MTNHLKRNLILGILFFLPVIFLLFLYPSQHHYEPLDILKYSVSEIDAFPSDSETPIAFKNHITILGFFGDSPENKIVAASNLKELIYDVFKGFKGFQVVIVIPHSARASAELLRKELSKYDVLKYWHFVYTNPNNIHQLYSSLNGTQELNNLNATDHVYIIDSDLNIRGRKDDRDEKEIENNIPPYSLGSYNCLDIDAVKNKMTDDLRILLTEYRQRRKGKFDSSSRRNEDLKK